MAQFIELDLDQGADFTVDLDFIKDDGSVLNIANYSFTSSMRKSFYSSSVAANLTVTVANTSNGNIILSLNAATTSNIKAGRYLFDVKQIDNSSVTTRLVEGIITVLPQVTK
jgi:hypothetical protein